MDEIHYATFREFYLHYLTEHQHPANRFLHFIGTSSLILLIIHYFLIGHAVVLLLAPLASIGFAWIGHFFIEKNSPIVGKNFFYNFVADFVMAWDILNGQIYRKIRIAKRWSDHKKQMKIRQTHSFVA